MTDDEAKRERCEVVAGESCDEIAYCRTMAAVLDRGKRAVRVGTMMNLRTGEDRYAVIIDLGRDAWSWCRHCPFCGASITTRFRQVDPPDAVGPREGRQTDLPGVR